MSEYTATIKWERPSDSRFIDGKYTRGHTWWFDCGITVPASSSPHVVPLPYSVEENVDPEEAFIAAISSCHMLSFLSIAAKRRFIVDMYVDDVSGLMERTAEGKYAITKVTLRPVVRFSGSEPPTADQIREMHHEAHEECFIANSVKTNISIDSGLQ